MENIGNVISLQSPEEDQIKYITLNKIEYQLEEIYQAILESAKIEAPLVIHLKKIQNGSTMLLDLFWHFKDRSFEVITNSKKTIKSWEEGQDLLALFYETDLTDLPVHKKKLPEGKICVNPGDDLWYETPTDPNWQKLINRLFS